MLKKALLVLCFFLSCLFLPWQVYAAVYGEGVYGSGTYNVGITPTATPTTTTNSSSGSSGFAAPLVPGCSQAKPSSTPDLFQISSRPTSVVLYFSPSTNHRDRYYVSYGTNSGAQTHGFEFRNDSNGVVSVEIKSLQPKTTYFFRVRAGNGCQPGDWSNELSAKTGQRYTAYRWVSLNKAVKNSVTRRVLGSSDLDVSVEDSPLSAAAQAAASPSPNPKASPLSENNQAAQTQASSQAKYGLIDQISAFIRRLFQR